MAVEPLPCPAESAGHRGAIEPQQYGDLRNIHPLIVVEREHLPLPGRQLPDPGLAQIPPQVAAHSRAVQRLALEMCDALAAHGVRLNRALLSAAALLHDIGKRQTKAFFDSHGNPSPTAHYYGHEFASAYESLFVKFPAAVPESERLRVAALIVWHMTPHFFTQEKTRARYERLLGKKMLDDLAVIERSDRGAQV